MDQQLFNYINDWASNNTFIDGLMIFFSSYLLYGFVGLLIILLFIKSSRQLSIIGITSIIVSLVFNQCISLIYYKDRPFVTNEVNLLIEKGISSSFPSDQAVVVFSCALTVWLFKKSIGSGLLLLAFLVAVSRIYVGHHYPFDVLGSFIVALLSVTISSKVLNYITMRKDSNSFSQ